ncbi:hypothetical protein EVAR_96971_1 [Eumeta japonica]|uniref:Uncharacterized protein n=1 Tax=Eumeta variegata TaxID=151549 RepID=A0A4C1VCV7_EUMVA|nr:hypothetical protein EVAR_96971_1 [Eumeta japonica]
MWRQNKFLHGHVTRNTQLNRDVSDMVTQIVNVSGVENGVESVTENRERSENRNRHRIMNCPLKSKKTEETQKSDSRPIGKLSQNRAFAFVGPTTKASTVTRAGAGAPARPWWVTRALALLLQRDAATSFHRAHEPSIYTTIAAIINSR